MSWRFILSLVFALIVAIFAIQNAEPVEVVLLFKKAEISQALIILLSAVLGALIVALLSLVSQMKLKSAIRNDKKTITSLEKEINDIKTRHADVNPKTDSDSGADADAEAGLADTVGSDR